MTLTDEANAGGEIERPTRVMHLITGLEMAGAEMMLFRLISAMDRKRFHNVVYAMTSGGIVADLIRGIGVEVVDLGIERGMPAPGSIFELRNAMLRWRPDVIQTWMDHANLLGGITAGIAGSIPVVWSLHHSRLEKGIHRKLTIWVMQICAYLSSWLPTRIVCCAESTLEIHAELGYSRSNMVVIPNGFDLEVCKPRPDARLVCNERMGIPASANAVVVVGRYHPQKDHRSFVEAAGLFHKDFRDVIYIMCGEGLDTNNAELMRMIANAGIGDKTFLMGRRTPEEVGYIMSRSVMTSSSSAGEAFPLVIGEAMAHESVCVVTDVGDSALIVGDTGVVVRPRSPEAIAKGWKKLFSKNENELKAMGRNARERIEQNFSITRIAAMYQNLYSDVATEARKHFT